VLVLLVLASSSIACRTAALVAGLSSSTRWTTGVGVSVAKAQHPWTVVVGP
jgi:hypothetical protein